MVRKRPATLHSFLNVYRAFLTDLNVYLIGFATLNVYLAGFLQYILSWFFFLYAMFSTINLGNIVLQWQCWFTGSCFFFASPLISYLHVVVVLACLFVLLQFACLGFCNCDWNCVIPGGVVVACFFLRCVLFLVVWFDFAGFRSCACNWAFWCFLVGLLCVVCSCLPRVCNVGMLHP